MDEYEEDASFSWLGADSVSSTLFDAPANRPVRDDAVEGRPERVSRRVSLTLAGEEQQDDGYNPYDTGALERP